jgi:hypothetical protein
MKRRPRHVPPSLAPAGRRQRRNTLRDAGADRVRAAADLPGDPEPATTRVGTVESLREVVEPKDPGVGGRIVGDRVRVRDCGIELLR